MVAMNFGITFYKFFVLNRFGDVFGCCLLVVHDYERVLESWHSNVGLAGSTTAVVGWLCEGASFSSKAEKSQWVPVNRLWWDGSWRCICSSRIP